MDVRAQVSMTFHLDKCIGCHTCSIACKNHWTSRKGAEYMWWNNVETKPGTGYPTRWEDQEKYQGGFERDKDGYARLKMQGRFGALANLFSNPVLPTVDDYYEPWTYSYQDLFDSPEGDDQPTARPISLITGEHVDVDAGPNWDDDLGGSPVYAENDPNLDDLSEKEKQELFTLERMVFFYLPRICNHCLNAGCVAACPAGAIYKRGEDGIVLINQDKCRAWRMCISGCPYKKPYFNWETGKSEKCILCYPRLESGEAPACFHACVGRIRYLGVVLYDAGRIKETIEVPDAELVEAQRSIILDPFDPEVIAGAKETGINEGWIKAAQKSPVYKFVKKWEIALPLHPEFRTLPMLFYIPPLLPVMASLRKGSYEIEAAAEEFFSSKEQGRIGVRYLASLFSAGNEPEVRTILEKMLAVRTHMRARTAGDVDAKKAEALLEQAGLDADTAEAIYKLTSLPTFEDRFVLPPLQREGVFDATWPQDAVRQGSHEARGATGVGYGKSPKRGY